MWSKKVLLTLFALSLYNSTCGIDIDNLPTWKDIRTFAWSNKVKICQGGYAACNAIKNLFKKEAKTVPSTIITALKNNSLSPDDFTFYETKNGQLVVPSTDSKSLYLNTDALSKFWKGQQCAVGAIAALQYMHAPNPAITIPVIKYQIPTKSISGTLSDIPSMIRDKEKDADTTPLQHSPTILSVVKTVLKNEWFHLVAGASIELGFLHYMNCSSEVKKHALLSRLAKKGIPLACKTVAEQLQKVNAPSYLEQPKEIASVVLNDDLVQWSLAQVAQYNIDAQLTYDMDQFAVQQLGKNKALKGLRAMRQQYDSYKPKGFFDSLSHTLEPVTSQIWWNPDKALENRIALISNS